MVRLCGNPYRMSPALEMHRKRQDIILSATENICGIGNKNVQRYTDVSTGSGKIRREGKTINNYPGGCGVLSEKYQENPHQRLQWRVLPSTYRVYRVMRSTRFRIFSGIRAMSSRKLFGGSVERITGRDVPWPVDVN